MTHWRTFLEAGAPAGRYLPWREVARATGLSRTTAWRLQKRDDFPAPYAISPGRVGYREDEVDAWRASRDHSPARSPLAAATRPVIPARVETSGPGMPAGAASPAPGPPDPGRRAADVPAARQVIPSAGPGPRRRGAKPRRSQHAQAIAQQMRFDF